MEATPAVQEYAREKAQELMADFPRVDHVHIILDKERHLQKAEIVVHAKKHVHAEASESSDNLKASLDLALAKAAKQLRRVQDKKHDHRPHGKSPEN
jgi:putative sigma-54 modulation protein